MKIRSSHKFIWFERGPFVVLLILSLLSLSVPFSSAQTQSRQLQRQSDPVNTWPVKAKRWALVIGVGQYRDAQINALKGSVNDANNLANALVRYAGFPQDQVIVLTTEQPEERQPTRINILTYLSNLASLVPKDGLLLVSFAGHGIEREGQAFLIPSDARLSRDVSLLEESAVSVSRMHDRIKAIGVGQVMVLLDACRNDPGGRAGAPNNMSAAYAKFNFDVRNREVQAFATFYATAIGQRAYEYTEKRQGYFTWAIVEALKGGAANEKGEVTLSALVKYVQENVPKRIAIDLGASEQQKPFATIEGYRADELIVAVANNTLTTLSSSSTAKIPPSTGSSVGSVTDDGTALNNEVPLARVMSPAFAKDYIDKPIRVRVRFIAAGQTEAWIFGQIPARVMENRVAFRVSAPDEPVKQEVAFGSIPPHVFINKEKANLVFELKSGDLVVLTGSTVVGGRDRFTQVIFVATSITKVD